MRGWGHEDVSAVFPGSPGTRGPQQGREDNDHEQGAGVSARLGEPAVSGGAVEPATYASTSTGCLYVAFLVEVFALRIPGWKVSASSKAQVIRRHTWKTLPEVELATLDWVNRFNQTTSTTGDHRDRSGTSQPQRRASGGRSGLPSATGHAADGGVTHTKSSPGFSERFSRFFRQSACRVRLSARR